MEATVAKEFLNILTLFWVDFSNSAAFPEPSSLLYRNHLQAAAVKNGLDAER